MVSLRMPALSSSRVSSSPPRYFSMSSSSASATDSTSWFRYSSALSWRSAGISSISYLAPMETSPLESPGHTKAFMVSRSTTPVNADSEPIGSCITSGLAPRRLMMVSTVK
jgi:hypothetical protein